MRITLSLWPISKQATIPLNYQYPLAAAIYKILRQASPEYAAFLHDRGYTAPSGRLMKLFTFSRLWIPGVRRQGETLTGGPGLWRLQVSSPMQDEFVQHFVLGLFESAEIAIGAEGLHAVFRVEQVEALPLPTFAPETRFKCLSPIVASTMHERSGKLVPYYFRPEDAGQAEALRQNLLQKYHTIYGRPPRDATLDFAWAGGRPPKSRLVTLKAGTPEATKIKAFEGHFVLKGSAELMRVAWECGVGEHNSQGFGMVEVVS